MEINCDAIVEKYLLNLNPLYAFSFPIAIVVGIIFFGCSKAYNWSDNSYVNQILIPILSFLLMLVFIDIIARQMISKEKKAKLVAKCKLWMHDPSIKKHPILSKIIDMDMVMNYKEHSENFSNYEEMPDSNINEEQPHESFINNIPEHTFVETPISEIPNIHPSPLESIKMNSKCIIENNDCNICSGTENKYNLIAPIPGPQWLPQTAEAVQNRLKNNDYTASKC